MERGELNVQSVVESSLTSVSPIAKFSEDSSEEDESPSRASEFSAEIHVSHLRSIFQIFGIELEDWVVFQVAENASVNKKVAQILKFHI